MKLNFISFVKNYCDYIGVEIKPDDLKNIVNIMIMQNHFLWYLKHGSLESTQVKSYIVYNELIRAGYDVSANTFGETDSEGYIE